MIRPAALWLFGAILMSIVSVFVFHIIDETDTKMAQPFSLGKFESSTYIDGGFLGVDKTQIRTDKGTFMIKGAVSSLNNQEITMKNNKLCIENKCFQFIDDPKFVFN